MKPNEIVIKDIDVLRAIMERNYDPLLITISCEVAKKYGILFTEAWREPLHSGDVHPHGRAFDLRVRVYGSLERAEQIRKWINKRWEYDFKRPEMEVSIIHDSGKGLHFHVQTHNRTRRR
jgi:hypothetical protein